MKTRRYEGSELRRILGAMIADSKVCSRIAAQWKPEGMFDARWANAIGGWCVKYVLEYGKAPGDNIASLFESWAERKTSDEKTVQQVESFLQAVSDDHESEQSEYVLDAAKRYFDRVRAEQLIESAKASLENDKVEDAVAALGMTRTNIGEDSFVEPSSHPELWLTLNEFERVRPLITYHGDLGKFINSAFTRGSLYAFMAPEKTGKTTWMVDFTYQAIRNRNRVAYFDVGDGSVDEVLNRLACRTTGCTDEDDVKVQYPEAWDGDDPTFSERPIKRVDYMESYRAFRKLCIKEDAFRISAHSNSSISAAGVDAILSEWARDGWIPDVVVIDYADILAPPKGVRDTLDQIDETWKHLRRISQDRHCLVMTGTQSSSAAYGKEKYLLSKADFSGRKTKLAHVNGILGINVSPKEKDADMARINWVVRRKGRYNEKHYVRVAGCMAAGTPCVLSKR